MRFISTPRLTFCPPSSLSLLFGLYGLSGPRCLWIWYTIRIWHFQPEDRQWLAGVLTRWIHRGSMMGFGHRLVRQHLLEQERMCQMFQGRKTNTMQKCSDIKINGNNDAHEGQF